MNILIKPAPRFLTDLTIVSVNVSLDRNAIVTGFMTDNKKISESFAILMDQETYDMWGSNDEYVVNWVLNELGVERA